MDINSTNLEALRVGFKTTFQAAFDSVADPMLDLFLTEVPSSKGEERYGWIGEMPGLTEWVGDRVVKNLKEFDFSIRNKDWELTIGVDRNHIQDDSLGQYKMLFEGMGRSTRVHKPQLAYALLLAGFSTAGYDLQYLFDTDHPVIDKNGVVQSVANTDGGSGTAWFLICSNAIIKPIIFQNRKAPEFVAKDRVTDENVFSKKKFLYGVDSRDNVGVGLWQGVWGSKQTLDATNYAEARAALMNMTGDHGRPLGLIPDILLVCGADEEKARKLLINENTTGGDSNPWKGTAKPVVSPWLAQ